MATGARPAPRAPLLAERLGALLGAPVVGEPRRLSGGASQETWAFDLEAAEGPRPLILQAQRIAPEQHPDVRPRPRPAPLLRAARAAGVPVPAVVAEGDDAELGGAWIVVDRLEGTADPRAILAGDGLPAAETLVGQLATALARIHRIDPDGLGLERIPDPLADLRAMHDRLGQPHPVFELAFRALEATGPPPRTLGTTVVHGDFRMGNVLVGADGLAAVLDWELAHVGDPVADLAWPCVPAWRFGRHDRPAFGLGTAEQLVAAYEGHAGVAVDREALRWWQLHGTLRWGVICVVQAFTHLGGAERSLEHAVIGRRACEVEWDLLELLDPGGGARPAEAPPDAGLPTPHDRPTADELLTAARAEIGDEVLGHVEGRDAFRLRVALRAMGIVERETRLRGRHAALRAMALARLGAADEAHLAASVREGSVAADGETLAALRVLVRCKLEAANPRYLETYA